MLFDLHLPLREDGIPAGERDLGVFPPKGFLGDQLSFRQLNPTFDIFYLVHPIKHKRAIDIPNPWDFPKN